MGIWKLAFVALVVITSVSCSDSSPPTRAVGDGCAIATDCTAPLVCAFQRCHGQCADSRDCPAGQKCVGSQYPKLGICLLADETECKRHSDCPKPLVCGRREKCEEQCKSDRDCLVGQACGQGSCYEVPPGVDAGPPPVVGKESDTCIHTSDCQTPLVCILGFCAAECIADRDCPLGLACSDHVCRAGGPSDAGPDTAFDGTVGDGSTEVATDGATADAPPGYGKACSFTSECAGDLVCRADRTCGYECLTDADCSTRSYCTALHRCVAGPRPTDAGIDAPGDAVGDGKACALDFDCDDGVFCNGVERCLGGKCGAPAELACATHSSCWKGVCDEPSRTCLAPIKLGSGTDVDGDGHFDVACGGDDCDDTDAKTYAGAPERCDGVDNDCDRVVDNYAIAPRTTAALSAPVAGRDRNAGGGAVVGAAPALGLSYSFLPGEPTVPDISHVMVTGFDLATSTPAFTEKEFTPGSAPGVNGAGAFKAAAGGDTTTLVMLDFNNTYTYTRYAWLGAADGTKKMAIPLVPATSPSLLGDATVTWANGRYLVGVALTGSGATGSFGTIMPDGTYTTFPVASTGGRVADGSRIRVGISGTTLAAAWLGVSGETELAIHTLAGAKLYGPISLGAGNPVAVGGTSAGFVVATSSATATKVIFVSSAGVVGTSVTLGYPSVGGDGSTAIGAAILALQAKDGLHLVVGRGALTDGVDERNVFAPPAWSPNDTGQVDVIGGRIFLSYFVDADNRTRFIEAGCLP